MKNIQITNDLEYFQFFPVFPIDNNINNINSCHSSDGKITITSQKKKHPTRAAEPTNLKKTKEKEKEKHNRNSAAPQTQTIITSEAETENTSCHLYENYQVLILASLSNGRIFYCVRIPSIFLCQRHVYGPSYIYRAYEAYCNMRSGWGLS